jgi:predicted HTH domain antitoxin
MPTNVSMEIPGDVLGSAHLTVSEAKTELAIALFVTGRLSQGKAAEFAGMPVGEFQLELGRRHIGPRYNEAEAREDAATLAALRRS